MNPGTSTGRIPAKVSDAARATYRDGMLRIELPLVRPESRSRSVPIEVDRDRDVLEGQ